MHSGAKFAIAALSHAMTISAFFTDSFSILTDFINNSTNTSLANL
jgi:hypothetical protein